MRKHSGSDAIRKHFNVLGGAFVAGGIVLAWR
jgi:hypothetical protein